MVIAQPDCAGDIPSVPVSWYGVASPFAVSGCAGMMMSQFTFAATVTTGLVDVAVGLADALPLADALGLAPSAVCSIFVLCEPP